MDTTFVALLSGLLFVSAAGLRWKAQAEIAQWIALSAVMAAAIALESTVSAPGGLRLGVGSMLAVFIWLVVLLHLPLRRRFALEPLDSVIWLLAGLGIPLALIVPNPAATGVTELNLALRTHIVLSLLAWAMLTLAALQSAACAVQSHRLRAHRKPIWPTPLMLMEKHLFRLIAIGWVLLLSAIATGFVFVDDVLAQHLAHKTAFTILAAILFGILLAGQTFRGWRGDQALRWVWGAWITLFVGYAGVKWILEHALQRSWS